MAGGLGTYVVVSGTTGSCSICAAITEGLGIPSVAASIQSLDTLPSPSDSAHPQAPAWTLQDLDGQSFSSSQLSGDVVLLDFYAHWCPPCRMMVPSLVELQDQYRDQGLTIVGVSLDNKDLNAVAAFKKQLGVNYISLLGTAEVSEAFGGIQAFPTTILVDRQGRLVSKHVGFIPKEDLETKIKSLL